MQVELDSMKMRLERDKGKLKFYKAEYITFEMARKTFEEHKDNQRKEIIDRDKKLIDLNDKYNQQVELNRHLEFQLSLLKDENEQFAEQSKTAHYMRRDLESKLKLQLEQTTRLQNALEDAQKKVKALSEEIAEATSDIK